MKTHCGRFCWVASLLALLGFISVGCKAPRNYHGKDSVIQAPTKQYSCAFIEFDDQGELWQPEQVQNAVNAIKENSPVFLVVYAHGWKNNAEPDNGDYKGFTNMLQALSISMNDPQQKVVGLYLAWRGDSVLYKDPISWTARQLSFWSRKNAAEKVAGTSATESLYRVLQAANANDQSKVVLIGHSMGALILEKALSQAMVGGLLQSKKEAKPPADLVLLINSAAPSLYARQFISMLHRLAPNEPVNGIGSDESQIFTGNKPLIISATSKGDWATRKLFPMGMRLDGVSQRFRSYETNDAFPGKQFDYYVRTAANHSALWSHRIEQFPQTAPADKDPSLQGAQRSFIKNLKEEEDPLTFNIEDRKYRIEKIEGAANETPYWVMQVPKSIISDHSDIFTQRFTGFVGALFRFTQVTDASEPRSRLDKKQFQMKQ